MSDTALVRRPGVVTFVGIVLYIKAIMAVIVGIALLVERNNSLLLDATGRDGDYITGTAVGEFIAAALLFAVAWAIMNGYPWARIAVAVVVGVRIVLSVWWMITHFGGGLQWRALVTVGLGIFVLWALYGNDQSETYFEGHP